MIDITPQRPAGRQSIDSYQAGWFRIAGAVHEGSVIVFPDRVQIPDAKNAQAADGGPSDPFVQGLVDTFVGRYVDFVARLKGYPAPRET